MAHIVDSKAIRKAFSIIKGRGKKGISVPELAAKLGTKRKPVSQSTVDNFVRRLEAQKVVRKVQGPPHGVGKPPMVWIHTGKAPKFVKREEIPQPKRGPRKTRRKGKARKATKTKARKAKPAKRRPAPKPKAKARKPLTPAQRAAKNAKDKARRAAAKAPAPQTPAVSS